MTKLFRLDASIRQAGSVSRSVATTLEDSVRTHLQHLEVIRRDVGLSPLPHSAWAEAVEGGRAPAEFRTPAQAEAVGLANSLADEMVAADAFIFVVPLYNFGVSQHVKAWVDLLVTEQRFGVKVPSPVAGRPAYLISVRGGAYGAGTPREGWDHATPWLRRMFEDVWRLDFKQIEVELTLADVKPEMAHLRNMAAANLENGHAAAAKAAEELSNLLRDAA